MARTRLLLDACVLINILATGRWRDIAAACDAQFVIVEEVAAEAFYLRDDDVPEGPSAFDLKELITSGDLEVVALDDTEFDSYVALAAHVDGGEAATIAVAGARDWVLATDDRAALRLLDELDIAAAGLTTPSLMRAWAASTSAATLATALRAIEQRARFVPGNRDPDATWWREAIAQWVSDPPEQSSLDDVV